MDYINYVKQSPIAGFMGYGGGATGLAFRSGESAVYYGDRGVSSFNYGDYQYIDITSTGNATSFGNLFENRNDRGSSACSNGTRAVTVGGDSSVTMEYITIASPGNGTDFGDVLVTGGPTERQGASMCSNGTLGIILGGNGHYHTRIDYITIETTGNSALFGDLGYNCRSASGASNKEYALNMAGYDYPSAINTISRTNISGSSGNASDIGDASNTWQTTAAAFNETRMVLMGGTPGGSTPTNNMEYKNFGNTGNSSDFGDLDTAVRMCGGSSNLTRGICWGGWTGNGSNYIQYITVDTTGNASDFGDTVGSDRWGACGASGSPS